MWNLSLREEERIVPQERPFRKRKSQEKIADLNQCPREPDVTSPSSAVSRERSAQLVTRRSALAVAAAPTPIWHVPVRPVTRFCLLAAHADLRSPSKVQPFPDTRISHA